MQAIFNNTLSTAQPVLSKQLRDKCACLTPLHSKRPKLYTILAFLNAIGLSQVLASDRYISMYLPF